jgi:NAD(P)-dependent dehydrogenase (short-subunit alcohol dehydrogenase family)
MRRLEDRNGQGEIMTSSNAAFVTGATSGLGFEAAAQLAESGWSTVVITGRTESRASEARGRLVARTGKDVFRSLVVDLDRPEDVARAAAELKEVGHKLGIVILNAGVVPGSEKVMTDEDIEVTFASSLIGHHQLTMRLLADDLLADDARIIIAGSEAARGDVPTFNPTDLHALADSSYGGDLTAAAEGLIRADGSVKFKPATSYANAKVFVAWWAAQLAQKLPEGMTVNAVSPGSAPDTQAGRNANFFMKKVMMPALKHAPKRFGMAAPVSVAAARYIEVTTYDGVTGEFFASAPKKMTGPIEAMQMPHLRDEESQKAGWDAVVKVAGGVDYPVAA